MLFAEKEKRKKKVKLLFPKFRNEKEYVLLSLDKKWKKSRILLYRMQLTRQCEKNTLLEKMYTKYIYKYIYSYILYIHIRSNEISFGQIFILTGRQETKQSSDIYL